MSEIHDQALHLLVQPQVGVFLTAEAREMVLRALEECSDLRNKLEGMTRSRDKWQAQHEAFTQAEGLKPLKARAEAAEAKLSELRERFDMIIGLAAIDKPEGSPAPALSEEAGTPSAADSPKAEQEAGDVVPEEPQSPNPTCAGWNKAAMVVCGTRHVSVTHEGKHYCLRHAPDRKERLEQAGATP